MGGQVYSTLASDGSLLGRTAVITGGGSGIGKETALGLLRRGARVVIGCRDRGERVALELSALQPGASVVPRRLDLAAFSSVRQFAREILDTEPNVHILVNNAGVAGCPQWQTEDGFEMQFGVNHLGHFLLTLLLVDRLRISAPARIVNVSSIAHKLGKIHFEDINLERSYKPLKAYQQSKLANILFTSELAKRLQGTGVTTYSLHPGVVDTGLGRHLGTSMGCLSGTLFSCVSRIFFKTVQKGAQTTIYCAAEESLTNESGCYYSNCRRAEPSARARDDEVAKHLWELSEHLTGTYLEEILGHSKY